MVWAGMSSQPSCPAPRKLTQFKHVNLFSTEVEGPKGPYAWTFASRKETPGADPACPDAVVIIAIVPGAVEPRLGLTREFRVPLGRHELSVPSGLVDPGETPAEAARRELKEETGLELRRVVHVSPALASSAGLTDETVSLVYVEAGGGLSTDHLDTHEDITTRLVSLEEIRQCLADCGGDIISSRVYPVLLGFLAAGRIALPPG